MNASRALSVITLAAVVLVLCGCGSNGPKLYPTRGKVMVNDKPAAGALVVFHPKGDNTPTAIRPSAVVADDGTFALVSGADGPGAPAGEYVVTVIWEPNSQTVQSQGKIKSMGGEESKVGGDKLAGRYATPAVSKLIAVVEAKDNELPPFLLK